MIISSNFGTNFSGGSLATHEIFTRLQNEFCEIIVVCKKVGTHSIKRLKHIEFENWIQAYKILQSLDDKTHQFYGDFYNAYLLCLANKPFYFTYHDNWPELGSTSLKQKFLGAYYWWFYKKIFKKASVTVSVSKFKTQLLKKITSDLRLIRNGFERKDILPQERIPQKVLMVGNLDDRKYGLAIAVFDELKNRRIKWTIDIYGHKHDSKLAERINTYDFVNLLGFSEAIPYHTYSCLLHTSMMENLSIVWCEALYLHLPIITFNVGGASEVINAENGILIPAYNIEEMSEALTDVIDHQKKWCFDDEWTKEFSWEIAATKYKEVLLS